MTTALWRQAEESICGLVRQDACCGEVFDICGRDYSAFAGLYWRQLITRIGTNEAAGACTWRWIAAPRARVKCADLLQAQPL
jgi:hypothetical protein